MLSFTAADHERVQRGELTVTWRLWKYAHVKAGGDYSTGFGFVHIDDVTTARAGDVMDADAIECGLPDAAALVELACSHTGATATEDTLLYRVRFHYLEEPPEKPQLGFEEIDSRLRSLDRASPTGPWTVMALRLIEDNPGVAARLLAPEIRLDTPAFKTRVRRLKALGLTLSLESGYELSERGQAYLDRLQEDADA